MTGKQFFVAIAAVVAALAAGGVYAAFEPGEAHGAKASPRSITVVGTGVVTTTPDRADFWFGVHTKRARAEAAMAANAAKMRSVLRALRANGIADRDLQTQTVAITPDYSYDNLDGYVATSSVIAKIRDIVRAGTAIDAAVEAGATTVWGPSLFRSDRTELARAALRAAIVDARSKAEAVAAASGASLGPVVSVLEQGAVPPGGTTGGIATGGTSGTTGTTGVSQPPTPVVAGEQSVQATASVTFTTS